MESDGRQLKIIVIILILLVFTKGLFTACEYAVIEANDVKVKKLASTQKKYQRLLKIIEKPSKLITSFSVGKIAMNMLLGIFFLALDGKIAKKIEANYGFGPFSYYIFLIAVMIAAVVVIVVFTEILPKKFVGKKTEKFAAGTGLLIKSYITLISPMSMLAYQISALFCKIFSIPISSGRDVVTEEEIRMMVDAGNETGVIEKSQREMINNIFEFGDADVSDVMTHRKDICAVGVNSKIGDVVFIAINDGYSRIPVYEETVDNIIGIIYVKDLLCLVGCENSEDFTVKQFMRKTLYLPETCKCNDAFETLTREKAQCAIVVDEYGGTAGLVSMEDMLEEIVGNIQDEYDDEKAEIIRLDEDIYTISGDTSPEDVEEILEIKFPENHNYDTMSAFIVDLLGHIPDEEETPAVNYDNVEFTVLLVEDNWISKIKAVKTKRDEKKDED